MAGGGHRPDPEVPRRPWGSPWDRGPRAKAGSAGGLGGWGQSSTSWVPVRGSRRCVSDRVLCAAEPAHQAPAARGPPRSWGLRPGAGRPLSSPDPPGWWQTREGRGCGRLDRIPPTRHSDLPSAGLTAAFSRHSYRRRSRSTGHGGTDQGAFPPGAPPAPRVKGQQGAEGAPRGTRNPGRPRAGGEHPGTRTREASPAPAPASQGGCAFGLRKATQSHRSGGSPFVRAAATPPHRRHTSRARVTSADLSTQRARSTRPGHRAGPGRGWLCKRQGRAPACRDASHVHTGKAPPRGRGDRASA